MYSLANLLTYRERVNREGKGWAMYLDGAVRPGLRSMLVRSDTHEGRYHVVLPKTRTERAACDCEDFSRRVSKDPTARCKHLWAVRFYFLDQRRAAAAR